MTEQRLWDFTEIRERANEGLNSVLDDPDMTLSERDQNLVRLTTASVLAAILNDGVMPVADIADLPSVPSPLTISQAWTYEEINKAINDGAEMVTDGFDLLWRVGRELFDMEWSQSIRAKSLVDLVVNAACEVLQHGEQELTLNDVIRLAYSEDPDVVRGWVE